jgi:DNA-binding transcriptional ArsR family regulator
MSDREPSASALDRETAFSLLADETRVRILTELGAATASPETGIPLLSYADLQSRVGVADSGQFNYHLTKLVGHYITKTEDGYRLRWPGMVLYRTLVAGLLTDEVDPEVGRFPVGVDCHRCGEPVEASLYETLFRVRCWHCDANYADIYVPTHGLVDRDHESLLQAVHQRNRTVFGSMVAGQCPWCASEIAPELHSGDDSLPSLHDTRDLDAYVIYHCTECTGFQYAPVSQVVLHSPAAVAFYHERGDDLTAIPAWELAWAVTDATTTVLDNDPWRFRIYIPYGTEQLVVELDEALEPVRSWCETADNATDTSPTRQCFDKNG